MDVVVHLGRCSRISSVYRVFPPAGVGTSSVRVCDGKRELVRVDLRERTDLSIGPEWLEYFKYGFEHRVRGSEVGTHPGWDDCRDSEGMQGERES